MTGAMHLRPNTRVGCDGRVRSLCAAEGRAKADRLLTSYPDTPLWKLIRNAGISAPTAKDVSDRVHAAPSRRFSELSRPLLRLPGAGLPDAATGERLVTALPARCVVAVASVAHQYAEIWHWFAVRLDCRAHEAARVRVA